MATPSTSDEEQRRRRRGPTGDDDRVAALAPLLDAVADAVLILDAAGRVRLVNDAFAERFGDGDELEGSGPPFATWPPEHHDRYATLLSQVLRTSADDPGPAEHEVELLDAFGARRVWRATTVSVELGGERMVAVVLRDGADPVLRLRALEGVLQRVAREVAGVGADVADLEAVGAADALADHAGLSARQRQVLRLFAEGHDLAAIAERLHLTVDTVRSHLKAVYRRLEVGSQRELRQRLRASPPP